MYCFKYQQNPRQYQQKPEDPGQKYRQYLSGDQDFQREDHLFDKVGVADDQIAAGIYAVGKEIVSGDTAKHDYRIGSDGVSVYAAPAAGFEDKAEDKGVNAKHHQWLDKVPEKTQKCPFVSLRNVAHNQLMHQRPVLP